MGHELARFLGVAGSYVHHIRKATGIAEEVGTREVADKWHHHPLEDGHHALRGRGTDTADDGEHLIGGDEPACIVGREVGVVLVGLVTPGRSFLPLNAAREIAFVKGAQYAAAVLETRVATGARKSNRSGRT